MKVSELIIKLEELKNKEGDVPVVIYVDGFGGHGIHHIQSAQLGGISEDYFDYEEDAEAFFADYEEKDISTIELKVGDLIYAT